MTALADDVRVLPAQITAKGSTPAASLVARLDDLPERTEILAPIPGPKGVDKREPAAP